MRVQPISRYYTQNDNTAFKSAILYSPKSPLHKINPIVRFMDCEFYRSLNASRKEWWNVKDTLKPYLNTVTLKLKRHSSTICWDINKDNRTKYLIILHGLSHNITNLQPLYNEIINKTDYAILSPEYQGFTQDSTDEIYLDPKTLIKSPNAAIKYLKDKGIKEQDICILGHSFGGYVAAECAKDYPNLNGLILVSSINTYKYISESIKEGFPRRVPDPVKNLVMKYKILTWYLGLLFNTSKCLKKVDVPVSIIHSKSDKKIKPETAEFLAKSAKNLKCLNILDEGSHRMDSNKITSIVSLLQKN